MSAAFVSRIDLELTSRGTEMTVTVSRSRNSGGFFDGPSPIPSDDVPADLLEVIAKWASPEPKP